MQKTVLLNRIKELNHPLYPEPIDHTTNLKSLTGIKCVAFDFYGTMFISGVGDIGIDENTQESNARYFEEALEQSGLALTEASAGKIEIEEFQKTIRQHIDKMKKNGIKNPEPNIIDVWRDTLKALRKKNFIEGVLSRDIAKRFAIEFEFRANNVWPLPDLDFHLKSLQNNGLTLGIISNSQFYTPLTFEALMGSGTAEFGFAENLQIWSYKQGIKKPSVSFYRIFTDALASHRLTPNQVLYVGNDLFKDVVPAKKLGMKTALYVGDRCSVRHETTDLIDEQLPDLIIDDLTQIIECV